MALLTPFLAFWPPHLLGGSGVLATVVAGLYVSWNGPKFIAPATRLQGFFVWNVIVYLIEGLIFLLTGLQARVIADSFDIAEWQRLVLASVAVCAVVIVVRFVWVFAAASFSRLVSSLFGRRSPVVIWQQTFIVGFTGVRGVVSLAAALSIPLTIAGEAFPERGLILLVTFCVILVTLIGQGALFPWVVTALGLDNAGRLEAQSAKRREIAAHISGIAATLAHLDDLSQAGASDDVVESLRRRHADRRTFFLEACKHFWKPNHASRPSTCSSN